MQRRSFLQQTTFAFGALTLGQQSLLKMFFEDPYKITMLRNDVGIFTERGGTIGFLLGKDEIVVVDSQFPEQSTHLIEALKKKSANPFSLLINTHHHGDHTAGNISFKGIAAHVLAHTYSKENQRRVAIEQKKEDQQLLPDRVYTDTWCENAGKEKICLNYFGAGHTNGDSLVHFQHADIVHMGDLVFNRRHPFIDRTAGANIHNWMEVLEKATKKYNKKTIFIYGHAADGYEVTGNREDLKAFCNYLEKLLAFAQREFKAGKSKEEFLKNTMIPGVTEWKGDGIQRPLTAAYEEVAEKAKA